MSYIDVLPKRSPNIKTQCQILDENGNRCENRATVRTYAHLDVEMFGETNVEWVVYDACEDHLHWYDKSRLELEGKR